MKSMIKNTRIVIALVASLISLSAFAGNNPGKIEKSTPIAFKFIGIVNEVPVFELKVDATVNASEYSISVTDQSGVSYYREYVKITRAFTKKFIFAEEINENPLFVTVTNRSNNNSVVYKVENKFNYSQETLVTVVSQ